MDSQLSTVVSRHRALVLTGFVGTVTNRVGLLGELVEQNGRAAVRARLGDGLVPGGEFAIRIPAAPVERLAALGAAHDEFPRAVLLGARDAERLPFDVFALGIIAARRELSVASVFDHEMVGALRALLLEQLGQSYNDVKVEFKSLEDLDTIVNIGGSNMAMARFGINATFNTVAAKPTPTPGPRTKTRGEPKQ